MKENSKREGPQIEGNINREGKQGTDDAELKN